MYYPHVKFSISKEKDFKTLRIFTKEAIYDNGRNLNWAVFSKYPQLKTQFDENKFYKIKNKNELLSFVNEKYRVKHTTMNHALAQHGKRWRKISPRFYSLVETIFGDHKWPRGKYVAFGTIWGMFPRFLKDKTFQIPFWHKMPRYVSVVIAHELLHFMFYDYFYTRYPKYRAAKHNFFVWHVSEIFNTIVQNSPVWLNCFKLKSLSYPEHDKIVKRLSARFCCSDSLVLGGFVGEIINEVKKMIK